MKKLNLGCGQDIRIGWVNADRVKRLGVNVVADFDKKFPFKNAEFDHILIKGVYEHINNRVRFWEEVVRILKVGGTIEVWQNPYTHTCAWGSPDHKIGVSYYLFSHHLQEEYGLKIVKTNWGWWAWLLERFGLLENYHVILKKPSIKEIVECTNDFSGYVREE